MDNVKERSYLRSCEQLHRLRILSMAQNYILSCMANPTREPLIKVDFQNPTRDEEAEAAIMLLREHLTTLGAETGEYLLEQIEKEREALRAAIREEILKL